jgi:drug/metabolite transporter (DMT)-like permease
MTIEQTQNGAPPGAKAKPFERPIGAVDLALYAVLVIIWGGSFYAIEFQLGVVPIETSILYRYVAAAFATVFICVATRRSLFRFSLRDHGQFVLLGFLFFSFNYVLIYRAQVELTSGLAAISFTMALFFTTINARVFLGAPFSRRIIMGGLIGVAGLALIFQDSLLASDFDRGTLIGIALILGAAYVVSLATIVTARLSYRQIPGLQANTWGMIYGSLFNAVFVLVLGHDLAFDLSGPYILSLLYLTFLAGVVGFVLYYVIVVRIGPSRSSYFTLMSPMVAIVISSVFEGLPITLALAGGVAAVLVGNYIAVRTRKTT